MMTWLLTGLSIIGVILNIHKRREGFLVWMVTNTSWMIIDFAHGLPAQGALFGVYLVLSIVGWFKWGKKI